MIIIYIFKEDNVFSMTAILPYGPPVNTDIDCYRTYFRLFFVSVAMFVRHLLELACDYTSIMLHPHSLFDLGICTVSSFIVDFVCFEDLHPAQQFFSHVGTASCV